MKEKGIFNKCKWMLLMVLCVAMLAGVGSSTVSVNAEDYPEIIPENLTCYYGYDYLGTLENGDVLQRLYEYVNEWAWEFYCSDEEITNIKEYVDQDGESLYQYYAIYEDIGDLFTAEELEVIYSNWQTFCYSFFYDTPIYYYMRSAAVAAEWSVDSIEAKVKFPAQFYKDEETGEWLEDFVSVENRMAYRVLIEEKLHEYYDLTRDMETDYEKERAIYQKLISEVDYSHEDLYNLYSHSVIGAFTETKTVCDGYAQAFQLICNYCGIDCIWVNGTASFTSHAWNAVKLDNEWYCVDATWGDRETAIPDDQSIWYTNMHHMADMQYTERYLNTPASMFALSHKPSTLVAWPEFSNDISYWSGYIMNEKADVMWGGTISDEQLVDTCAYICEEIEAGNTVIELHAWDSWILSTEVENLIEETINDFVSSTGKRYQLAKGFSFSVSSSQNDELGHSFSTLTLVLNEKVDYSDSIKYAKHNIDGSGEGILVTELLNTSFYDRVYIPEQINNEEVRALAINVETKQLVIPDGVRILEVYDTRGQLEQVVIPETVRDIYVLRGNMESIYLPRSVKYIDPSTEIAADNIYGYADTVAETYAEQKNRTFYNLTGKDLIDTISLEDVILPETGEEFFDVLESYENASNQYTITSIIIETEDEYAVMDKEYTVSVHVKAEGNYAITPNTLADVNGSYASIKNVDVDEAVITFTFVPKDNATSFVYRLYTIILGREPDRAGLEEWTGYLENGVLTGAEVAKGFIMSDEFLNEDMGHLEFVRVLYRAFFGREADESGLATWAEYLYAGYRKSYIFAGFANSTEFGALCEGYGVAAGSVPVTISEQQPNLSEEDYNVWLFVERMYTEVLDRPADMAGIQEWVALLKAGTWTGSEVASGFIMSEEFQAKEMSNEEYVQIMYSAFFGREADPTGLETWVNALETDFTKEFVFAGFANSDEFGVLCESYGITRGSVEVPEQ